MFVAQQLEADFLTKELLQQLGSAFWIGLDRIRNQRDQKPDILSVTANVYDSSEPPILVAGPLRLDVQPCATQPPLLQAGYLLQTGPNLTIVKSDVYRVVYAMKLRTGEVKTLQQSFVLRDDPYGAFKQILCCPEPPESCLQSALVVDLELIADNLDSTANALNATEYEYQYTVSTAEDVAVSGTQTYSSDGVYLRTVPSGEFDGTGYFLTEAANENFNIDPVGWFGMVEVTFVTKDPNPALNHALLEKGDPDANNEWGLTYRPDDNDAQFYFTTGDGSTYNYVRVAMPTDPTLTRHFFFFWKDPVEDKMWLQRDDQAAVSTSYTAPLFASSDVLAFGAAIGITATPWRTGNTDAKLRHFRIWRGPCVDFTEECRAALYNAGEGVAYDQVVAGIPACS